MIAKEKGLQGLADLIIEQRATYDPEIEIVAADYVSDEKALKV